uniref:DNA-directed RNA polymerase n=1 Tax=Cynoglossus semilaevis TaxID=244447 RepID=A0A3P8UQT3_CYNSE
MSLLRLCAFAKCLGRRGFLQTPAVRTSFADDCQLCSSLRNRTGRRQITGTAVHNQRTNVSFVFPKKEDVRKRLPEHSQLLDVLEARVHQLLSHVTDVPHAQVPFHRPPSSKNIILSGISPNKQPQKVTDKPKSKVKADAKSLTSPWKQRISQEKKTRLIQQQHLRNVKIDPSKIMSSVHHDIAHKTIFLTPKKTATSTKIMSKVKKVSDKNDAKAAIPQTATSTVTKGAGEVSKKLSKMEQKPSKNSTKETTEEAAKMEKPKTSLRQKLNQKTTATCPQEGARGSASVEVRHSVRAYLEACLFSGNIDTGHSFLLKLHRMEDRRKHLNTDIYNILMSGWAKKGSLNNVGQLFILLEEAALKPNLGSYSAALECMGRWVTCPSKVITRCLDQMKKEGLSVDDLFSQCVFHHDEKDMVLKAVHAVHPEYQPQIQQTTSQFSLPLVNDFYTQRENHQYPKLHLTQAELLAGFKRQLSMELACTVTINSVEAAKPLTENMAKMREHLNNLNNQWHKTLLKAFREKKMILVKTSTKYQSLYPYLCLLEDKDYVNMMIQSISTLLPTGLTLTAYASSLGTRVYTKYCVLRKQQNQMVQKLGNIYKRYAQLLANNTQTYTTLPREHWCQLETEQNLGLRMEHGAEKGWPDVVTLKLGSYLVDLIVKNLKIRSDILNPAEKQALIPILYHMYTFRNFQQIGFIKPHPILTQILSDAVETTLTFDSYIMPMLCPPVPWTSASCGAYLLTPTNLTRAVDGGKQQDELEKCPNLDAVLDSLNTLGNCAWRINKPVLDIIVSVFNDRGSDKLNIPPPLSEAPQIPNLSFQDPANKAAERNKMRDEANNARKKRNEMHSLRMEALYKLSIANCLRDEIFWLPHNMDFRGRTYPCPPYFNHLGGDMARSILVFAEGKPLGPKGLDWLKLHLINLTGVKKKSSLQERLEYANTIMEDILDSADNPLDGRKWWMTADEPWQALACCMEIAKAVRSPDPTQFISGFPIHQDGSCNGLQHYAALGRDVIGATSVNLVPCDVPQDVYIGVAHQVEALRAEDAQTGLKVAQVLEGFISRKVVKQTVMTVVYGVTRYGGRLQIQKRLEEIDEFPKEYVWEASSYLVRLVFSALKEMFTGTRKIQVNSPLQKINLHMHDINDKPDTVKQKNAFPPNFIHSLDSTHMMLTALHCNSAGLTFVSVHDCFWTHAYTVDMMNKVCREQFVNLHSQPILQELSESLLEKYCTELQSETYIKLKQHLAEVPETGNFDLHQVKESTYFFS